MKYIKAQYLSINDYINTASIYWLSFVTSLVTFWLSIVFGYTYRSIAVYEQKVRAGRYSYESWGEVSLQFFKSLLISPLWETFVFQFVLLIALKKLIKHRLVLIATAGVIFSLSHLSNSTSNAITIFPLGCLLAATFIFWLNKTNSKKKAFEATLTVHVFHNLYWVLIYVGASPFIATQIQKLV